MATEVRPPAPFTGDLTISFNDWMRDLSKYMEYKETPNAKKLQLLKYLLKEEAADWLEGLPAEHTDSYDHLREAMKARYEGSVSKFVTAKEIFKRRQKTNENIDTYIAIMRKMGKQIGMDERTVTYAVMNGMKPEITSHVIKQQPDSLEAVLTTARVAESVPYNSTVVDQLSSMQEKMAEMSEKMTRMTVAAIRPTTPPPAPKSPVQQRRVQFQPRTRGQDERWRQPGSQQKQRCTRCNLFHGLNKCPAQDPSRRCFHCNRSGHYAVCCFAGRRQQGGQQ